MLKWARYLLLLLLSIFLFSPISGRAAPVEHDGGNSAGGIESLNRTAEPNPEIAISPEKSREVLSLLIAKAFYMRGNRANAHTDFLLQAVKEENEEAAIKDILEMVMSLKPEQMNLALDQIMGVKAPLSAEAQKVSQRLQWVLEEVMGKPKGNSSVEGRVKDKAAQLKEAEESRVKHFQENLDKAIGGDEKARKDILDHYSPEALMDFLAQHKENDNGVKLAKVLGWQDKNGATYLDVMASSGSSDLKPEALTFSLGKTDQEIKTALNAFNDHALGVPASTANQLQHLTLNRDVSNLPERKFVAADSKNGHLEITDPHLLRPEDRKEFCAKEDASLIKAKETEHRPYYFFRPFPFSDTASYASLVDGHNRNFIKDMASGKEKGIPGSWDPVPTPDELYMTIPTTDQSSNSMGIKIYAMKDLIGDKADPEPIYEEEAEKDPTQKPLLGVYQSIGTTANDMLSSTYRIITDMDGLSFRDYRIFSLQGRAGRVEPLGDGPKRLCPQLGENISLPMLSKDGRFVSVLDTKEQVTKIYEIGEKGDRCVLVGNLGVATSKVDFSFDSDHPVVVFHTFNNQDEKEKYPDVPSDNLLSNVYMYDLKTRQISRLTNNTSGNSIYPAFKRDGTVVYLQHPHGAADKDNTEKSKLVVVDPKKANRYNFDIFDGRLSDRPADKERLKALTAIGGLWAELCSPQSGGFSSESAAMAALGIDKALCEKMVTRYWDKFQRQVSQEKRFQDVLTDLEGPAALSKEKLIAACLVPQKNAELSGNGTGNSSGTVHPTANVPQKCLQCHLTKIPWDDKEKLNEPGRSSRGKSYLDEIEDRMNQPLYINGKLNPLHMPKNQELSEVDRLQLVDWIKEMRQP